MMKRVLDLLRKMYHSEKLLLMSIFLISCLFAVGFLFFFKNIGPEGHRVPVSDYVQCYAPITENIIQGKSAIINNQYVRCAVGYPLVLAPIFVLADAIGLDRFSFIIFFNVIFAAFSSVILFLLVKNVFNKKIALMASVLWMSYPLHQWFIKNAHTEIPFILILLLAVLFFVNFFTGAGKKYYIFFTGTLLGFASLVRPIGLLISLVLAILIFIVFNISLKKKLILLLLLILGNVMILAPWEYYVFLKNGNFAPISDGGPEGFRYGFTFGAKTGEGGDTYKGPQDVIDIMNNINSVKIKNNKSYGEILSILGNEAIKSPFAFTKLMIIKAARSWYGTSELWLENKIVLIQLPYLILGILGIIFSFKFYKDKIRYIIMFLSIIAYFWFMTTATLSIMRYIVPVMPFVIIFSSVAMYYFLEKYLKNHFSAQ